MDRAVDYIRYFDPHFNWNIVEEMEQNILTKKGRVMPPLLQISLDEAKKEGWKLGQVDGIKKGRQEGMQQGMQQVALNMLKEKTGMSLICKVTGLSEAEINKLKNSDS